MDLKLLFLINREWTSPLLDKLMVLASSAAFWAIPLGLAALWLAWKGGFRGRVFVLVALVAFGITDGIIGRNLKRSVNRLRPHQSEFGVRMLELARPAWKGVAQPVREKVSLGASRFKNEQGRSFPSNHSANTAAVATIAALLFRWGWFAFFPALLVSYSRVYTGAHWPSDVVAGVCIGCGTGLVALIVAEWVWRKFGHKWAPRVAASQPSLFTRPQLP